MNKSTSGFTIIELLIVIVVIAILAAISIVTYNGMQQRARNQARISAAVNIHKQLELYTHDTGSWFGANVFCVPTAANRDAGDGGLLDCTSGGTVTRSEHAGVNVNFTNAGLTFSYPDTPIRDTNGIMRYGVVVSYAANLSQGMNGVLRPFMLIFTLEGANQDCGHPMSIRRLGGGLEVSDPLNSLGQAPNFSSSAGVTICAYSLTHPSTL